MSVLLGGALPQFILTQSDESLRTPDMDDSTIAHPVPLVSFMRPVDSSGASDDGWLSAWWPARSGVLDGAWVISEPSRYDLTDCRTGSNGRLVVAGISRDATGTALPSCTVRLVRTATSKVVDQGTSDGNGFFSLTSPYYEQHFVTVHASGVAGATVSIFPT